VKIAVIGGGFTGPREGGQPAWQRTMHWVLGPVNASHIVDGRAKRVNVARAAHGHKHALSRAE